MTIQINEHLRVIDKDANQYVLEKRAPKPNDDGVFGWRPIAYCGTPAGVVFAVEREIKSMAQDVANLEAMRGWADNPARKKCMDLPKKTGK